MRPGYVSATVQACRSHGIQLELENLAVGGTNSVCGLQEVKLFRDWSTVDMLVIAYALNDAAFYPEDRRALRVWSRTYEGIIRHVLNENPDLRIVNMVLPIRNDVATFAVPVLYSAVGYMADWYGLSFLNLAKEVVCRYGRGVLLDPVFYADMAHFSRPLATGIVGNILADHIDQEMKKPGNHPLPPAMDEGNYSNARVVLLADVPGATSVLFSNSRFSAQATVMKKESLSFDLEAGIVLGVAYVCHPQTTDIVFRYGGKEQCMSMMKSGVDDGAFPFLRAMLNCDSLYGPFVHSDPKGKIRYALGADLHDRERSVLTHRNSIANPCRTADAAIALTGILHTGTMTNLRLV